MAQEKRPERMGYFDFVMGEIHGLRIKELLNEQAKGRKIIEASVAVIVGEETCVGERGIKDLTESTGNTMDEMLDAIVNRYFKVDCAVFTPNPERLEHIRQMAKESSYAMPELPLDPDPLSLSLWKMAMPLKKTGAANTPCMHSLLEDTMKMDVLIFDEPQMTVAIDATILADSDM